MKNLYKKLLTLVVAAFVFAPMAIAQDVPTVLRLKGGPATIETSQKIHNYSMGDDTTLNPT